MFASVLGAAENPQTAEFLRILPGPSGAALGNTGVADAEAPFAASFNPSLLSLSPSRYRVAAEQSLWLMDVQGSHYAFSFAPVSRSGRKWGFGAFASRWGSEPFQATDPMGVSVGDVNYQANLFGMAAAYEPRRFFHIGAAVKNVSHGFTESGASGARAEASAMDLGLAWETPLAGIVLGAAIQNLGDKMKFTETAEKLPTSARAGAQGGLMKGFLRWRVEALRDRSGTISFKSGFEYRPVPAVGLRAGYDLAGGPAMMGLTSGISISVKGLSLDYSLTPMGDLGAAQRMAVSWRFGKRTIPPATGRASSAATGKNTPPAPEPQAPAHVGATDEIFQKWIRLWQEQTAVNENKNGKVVLLADDQQIVRQWLGRALRTAGYEVVESATNDEALTELERRRPDLVLLDQFMPGGDSARTLRTMKRLSPRTPVIVMTWLENGSDERVPRGAEAVLSKPVEAAHMLETVSRLLQNDPRAPSTQGGARAAKKQGQGGPL